MTEPRIQGGCGGIVSIMVIMAGAYAYLAYVIVDHLVHQCC